MLPTLTRAICRYPATTCADGITTSLHLGTPSYKATHDQFGRYVSTLEVCGLSVTILPADDSLPDGHFIEDPAVIFHDMAFITRPGNQRIAETPSIEQALQHLNIVHMQGEDATLEGGDVLFCADRVLIGITKRTNYTGAEQLKAALQVVQPDIRIDFVPLTGVLHLKTGVTELAPNVLLIHPQMQAEYDFSFAECVLLSAAEAYAADILPINDHIIIPAGYPTVEALAHQHYTDVHSIPMTEFEKMDGGLTCLSLRY